MSSSYDDLYPVVPNGLVSATWQPLDEDGESSGDAVTISNARSITPTDAYTEIDASILSDTAKHFALGLKDDSITLELVGGLRGIATGDVGSLTVTTPEGDITASGTFAVASANSTYTVDQLITTQVRFVRYRGKQ